MHKFIGFKGDVFYLSSCPFCGEKPKINYVWKDRSETRKITIKCPKCMIQRVNTTLKNDMGWLEEVAVENWNMREK